MKKKLFKLIKKSTGFCIYHKWRLSYSIIGALMLNWIYWTMESAQTNFFDDINIFAWKNHLFDEAFNDTSVIFFDVSYNADTVRTFKGVETITDRSSISHFLEAANRTNSYKFIFLDLHFKEGHHKIQDDSIVNLLNSMNSNSNKVLIVQPSVESGIITDAKFKSCFSAPNGYNPSFINSNFTRYSFMQNGQQSVALKMYNAIREDSISPILCGTFPMLNITSYTWKDKQFINCPIIKIPSKMNVTIKRNIEEYLEENNDSEIALDLKDKIVFVGALELDKHNTYSGKLSGSHITYLALKELFNRRYVKPKYVSFSMFVLYSFLLFFSLPSILVKKIKGMRNFMLKQSDKIKVSSLSKMSWLTKNRQITMTVRNAVFAVFALFKLIISLLYVLTLYFGVYFFIFMIVAYFLSYKSGIIYNIYIPLAFFTIVESLKQYNSK